MQTRLSGSLDQQPKIENRLLPRSGTPRRRLKQIMQLEIGRHLLAQGNPEGAARHLQEAKSASTGLKAIGREASELLQTLHE